MSTFTLLKSTFKNPTLLLEARKKNGFFVFMYMILLSLILSIPIFVQSVSLLSSFREDGLSIMEKIPDFSISNDTLVSEKPDSGFIYQTNAIIFTFDPDGKRSLQEVETDASAGVLSIALLKNEMVIVLPSTNSSTDLLDSHVLSLPYSMPQMNNINKPFLNDLLTNPSESKILLIVVLFISLLMVLFSLLINLTIMTFLAKLFSKFNQPSLKFKDTFKVLVYCATFPIILTVIIQLIWPSFRFSSISLALTMILYFNIFPRPSKKHKD